MACPKCGAGIETSEWITPSRSDAAKTILKDWRTWALAFGVMIVASIIANMLGFRAGGGAGGGAAIGMLVAMRMTRLRTCPKCAAVVEPAA